MGEPAGDRGEPVITYEVKPPLSNAQATQLLRDNPTLSGTVMSVHGTTGGKGPYAQVNYTVAYWADGALKAVSGVQSTPRLPDTVDVVAAQPGDIAFVVKRGARVDFVVYAFPAIEVCEQQP